MTCCHCQATELQFGEKAARADLKRYLEKGPDKTTLQILAAIRREDLRGVSLLDVGGGIGVLLHELLDDVADEAVHVEAASAYQVAARTETRKRGHEESVRFVHGDFLDLEHELPGCDVVTLDRVVCCYPDVESLVRASAGKARRLWIASYPRDRWYVRLGMFLENLLRRLTRNDFRTYVHSTDRLDALARAAGLTRCFEQASLVWETAAYRR